MEASFFQVSSEFYPNIDTENAWVVSELDIKCQPINVSNLKEDYDYLWDLALPPLNPGGVSFLFGANFPHIILHCDFRPGESQQPFAVKIFLGWILIEEKI